MHAEAQPRILIVSNDKQFCEGLVRPLEANKYEVQRARTELEAEQLCRTARPDIIILDFDLSSVNSVEVVRNLKSADGWTAILLLANYASLEQAGEALRAGAEEVFPKPANPGLLLALVQRCLERQHDRRRRLAEDLRENSRPADPFLGKSEAILLLHQRAQRAALSESAILIQGEAGTGKGCMGHWLHRHSARYDEPFVTLNCAAFAPADLEREMFGDESGSFADANHSGLLESGHKGTVFLEHIDSIDFPIQAKLLKVLDQKRLQRPGGKRDCAVDIRLIAATEAPLYPLVQQKRFRADLYVRLNSLVLLVPPLREHMEDIPMLGADILHNLALDMGGGEPELSVSAIQALKKHSWPGNVRELRCVLERAAMVSSGGTLGEADVRPDLQIERAVHEIGRYRTLEDVQREYIEQVLRSEGGRVESAARRLGIPRSSLYHKLKQYRAAAQQRQAG